MLYEQLCRFLIDRMRLGYIFQMGIKDHPLEERPSVFRRVGPDDRFGFVVGKVGRHSHEFHFPIFTGGINPTTTTLIEQPGALHDVATHRRARLYRG